MQQSAADQRFAPPELFARYFPRGLKLLVVGADHVTQNCIERQLQKPYYHIDHRPTGSAALNLLRGRPGSYDLVLSDVVLKDMDGYRFVRDQHLSTNIPHVVISGFERSNAIMQAFRSGVCYVLWKPVSECEVKNLWQHVCRRREQPDETETDFFNSDVDEDHNQKNKLLERHHHQNQKDEGFSPLSRGKSPMVENDSDQYVNQEEHNRCSKKRRIVWSPELHHRFVSVVNYLGHEKAVPKAILELMNVPFLTRENIASHLQKYRLFLKKEEVKLQQKYQQHMNAMITANQIPPSGPGETSYGRRFGNNSEALSLISAQRLAAALHPDMLIFQPPHHQSPNNSHLPEPSKNNSQSLDVDMEDAVLWSQAHDLHHSLQMQPHHYHLARQQQMQMQQPEQNLSLVPAVPLAIVPASPPGNGTGNTQQQEITQNLTSNMQQLDQNLVSGSSYGANMQQFDQNQASDITYGSNMQQQQITQNLVPGVQQIDQKPSSGSFYRCNMQQLDQTPASGSSRGGIMQQPDQTLASGSPYGGNMQQLDQNLVSGSCHVGNMQQQQITQNRVSGMQQIDQNLGSSSCHGSNMQQLDQNLVSSSSHGGNMQQQQITQNRVSGMQQIDQNLGSSSCHGGTMQQLDQNLVSGSSLGGNIQQQQITQNRVSGMQQIDQNLGSSSCRGGNMQQLDQNAVSGSSLGGNMQQQQITQNRVSGMQQIDQNLGSSSCHGGNMQQLDQNVVSGSSHGGNMQLDQNLASGTSYGNNMQQQQFDHNLASGSCHVTSTRGGDVGIIKPEARFVRDEDEFGLDPDDTFDQLISDTDANEANLDFLGDIPFDGLYINHENNPPGSSTFAPGSSPFTPGIA